MRNEKEAGVGDSGWALWVVVRALDIIIYVTVVIRVF